MDIDFRNVFGPCLKEQCNCETHKGETYYTGWNGIKQMVK